MSKSGKFILGALLGAGAAVLLTPITGKKARGSLRQAAEKRGLDVKAIQSKVESLWERGEELAKTVVPEAPAKRRSTRSKTKSKK